jgi:sporulation protein YlmC with PRC-barrel domain
MSRIECTSPRGVSILPKEEYNPGVDPSLIAATTVIGNKVIGNNGKELGKIEEAMMDLTTGSLSYLVLSTGGVLGIGDKFFAIPLDRLTFDVEKKVFYLDIDRTKLKTLPGFDKEKWPRKAEWPLIR